MLAVPWDGRQQWVLTRAHTGLRTSGVALVPWSHFIPPGLRPHGALLMNGACALSGCPSIVNIPAWFFLPPPRSPAPRVPPISTKRRPSARQVRENRRWPKGEESPQKSCVSVESGWRKGEAQGNQACRKDQLGAAREHIGSPGRLHPDTSGFETTVCEGTTMWLLLWAPSKLSFCEASLLTLLLQNDDRSQQSTPMSYRLDTPQRTHCVKTDAHTDIASKVGKARRIRIGCPVHARRNSCALLRLLLFWIGLEIARVGLVPHDGCDRRARCPHQHGLPVHATEERMVLHVGRTAVEAAEPLRLVLLEKFLNEVLGHRVHVGRERWLLLYDLFIRSQRGIIEKRRKSGEGKVQAYS